MQLRNEMIEHDFCLLARGVSRVDVEVRAPVMKR